MLILFTTVVGVGIIVLLAAVAKYINTHSKYRLGQASEMELREFRGGVVTTIVTMVIVMAAMTLVLWTTSDFFSSNSLAGESEEATTTPATTSTDTSDK